MGIEEQLNLNFDVDETCPKTKHLLSESGGGVDVFEIGGKKIKVRIIYKPEVGYHDSVRESDVQKVMFVENGEVSDEEKSAVLEYIKDNLG